MRDKSHDEQIERWAEFVRTNPREKWKKAVNLLIDAQYKKAEIFYKNLSKTEKGRQILKNLAEEKKKSLSNQNN